MPFAQDYARAAYGDQYARGHGYGDGDGAGAGQGVGDSWDGARFGQGGSVWAHGDRTVNGYPDHTYIQSYRLTQ